MKKFMIGGHLPADKIYKEMFEYAQTLEFAGIQFFSFSNRQWGINKLVTDEKLAFFNQQTKKHNDLFLVTHSCYLINLASDNEELRTKSCEALLSEAKRCKQLQVPATIVHPGSNKNEHEGINNIIIGLQWILNQCNDTIICLENSAGQGNTIPKNIEQMAVIEKALGNLKKNVYWCIDTCHAHASGYNFSDNHEQEKFWNDFDKKIGLERIAYIHCNDSMKHCGSKLDRHEFLGDGTIGRDGFSSLFNNSKLKNINKILETPFEIPTDYKKDLLFIQKLH